MGYENVAYIQALKQSAEQPFTTNLIQVGSNNVAQTMLPLIVHDQDDNGQSCTVPLNGQIDNGICNYTRPVKINETSNLQFLVLPNTAVVVKIYQHKEIVDYKSHDIWKGEYAYLKPSYPSNSNTVVIKQKTEAEKTRIPTGTFMLMWFTNPLLIGPDKLNSVSTQFYTDLEDAEKHAERLTGSRVILCAWQNRAPETNIFWNTVVVYGNEFDVAKTTIVDEKTVASLTEKYRTCNSSAHQNK